mmetsp:Transcript_28977/g.61023  ORF Transcript_28977/g.61023 Transcript_28977/m.61023 type:complete len:291 (+) Transcript_28977:225-1097(+)
MEGAVYLEFLANTLKDVSAHEELVAGIDSDARSNLIFLLSGHDLSVGSTDFDSGVEASAVSGIGDGAAEGVLGTYRAVVRSLRAVGESVFGPAEGCSLVEIEKGEFLFQSKPDFFVFTSLECFGGNCTGVSRQRFSGRSVSVAHDQNIVQSVVSWAERILKNTARSQDDLRVVAGSLIGGASVKIPSGEGVHGLGARRRQGAGFGARFSLGIDPDVLGQYLLGRVRKLVEAVDDGMVELSFSCCEFQMVGHRELSAGHRGGGCWSKGGGRCGEGTEGNDELHFEKLLLVR